MSTWLQKAEVPDVRSSVVAYMFGSNANTQQQQQAHRSASFMSQRTSYATAHGTHIG